MTVQASQLLCQGSGLKLTGAQRHTAIARVGQAVVVGVHAAQLIAIDLQAGSQAGNCELGAGGFGWRAGNWAVSEGWRTLGLHRYTTAAALLTVFFHPTPMVPFMKTSWLAPSAAGSRAAANMPMAREEQRTSCLPPPLHRHASQTLTAPLRLSPMAFCSACQSCGVAVPLCRPCWQGTGRQASPMMPLPCGASRRKARSLRSKCCRPWLPQHHFCRQAGRRAGG